MTRAIPILEPLRVAGRRSRSSAPPSPSPRLAAGLALSLLASIVPTAHAQGSADAELELWDERVVSLEDSLELASFDSPDGGHKIIVSLQRDRVDISRWSVNVGLRYEEDARNSVEDLDGIFSLSVFDEVAPRLGGSYRPGPVVAWNFDLNLNVATFDEDLAPRISSSETGMYGTVDASRDAAGYPIVCSPNFSNNSFDVQRLEYDPVKNAYGLVPYEQFTVADRFIVDTLDRFSIPPAACNSEGAWASVLDESGESSSLVFFPFDPSLPEITVDTIPLGDRLRDGDATESGVYYGNGDFWYFNSTGTDITVEVFPAQGDPAAFSALRAVSIPGVGDIVAATGDPPGLAVVSQRPEAGAELKILIRGFEDDLNEYLNARGGGPIDVSARFDTGPGDPTFVDVIGNGGSTDLVTFRLVPPPCTESSTTLCLAGDRYQVSAAWRTASGERGVGRAEALTSDTGYFWFFDPSNAEMLIKVLDACSIADRFWVFAGGLTDVEVTITVVDTETGVIRQYANAVNTPFQPIQATDAFATCGGLAVNDSPTIRLSDDAAKRMRFETLAFETSPLDLAGGPNDASPEVASGHSPRIRGKGVGGGSCSPGAGVLCLNDARFSVEVSWASPTGQTGQGRAEELGRDSGYFWFFDENNVEMMVKVLDACAIADRFWVFGAGLTNLEVEIAVTDTRTGQVRQYGNPQGEPFKPIQDTDAFATCP